MDLGRIRQEGPPAEAYVRPRNRFVASFIGKSNIFEGRIERADGKDLACLLAGRYALRIEDDGKLRPAGSRVEFLVRPERIALRRNSVAPAGEGEIPGVMRHVVYLGAHQNVHVALDTGQLIEAESSHDHAWQPGDPVAVGWRTEDALLLMDD